MTRHTYLFDMNDLFQARLEFAQEAGGLPPGTERDQKRRMSQKAVREPNLGAEWPFRRPPN